MKIILLKDIPKVGRKNEIKEVKDGFAMNLLFPKKLAAKATARAVKNLGEIRRKEEEEKNKNLKEIGEKIQETKEVKFVAKANDKGHLFGGLTREDISAKLKIPAENINLEHHLKEVGEHEVAVSVGGKNLKIKVIIEAEK
ncbi:50S ribosomal protein L9 [Candidatus Campbellbacteria bacterium CG11_big_fil_rev_8_21_14_0_20_44_21]|uniref:Large ribosomal subunit protein bL9 n=1 Tax=Candidatus Campbellbacteria bacterium CG22_combo_CG10-13_8_21_14_all_43_18 TaxID=1974530 RepID=A0A2H0DXC2_9BACT|nr:MAG: 50S ribosomal protein L9 [Candidatus Campbellbacteria bacterium CG22_combo_CG10-13_8_21_14_all_43_18]PIR24084.1 MAG: 50S ribosomal protein L9 [Candidatus Campbellbacteria bacterium CG11_big_fil_rev_8_21_14_0_20_44_21]